MQEALESAFADFALRAELPSEPAAWASFWARHGVPLTDAQALTHALPRLLVYRKLVRGNLRHALECTIPRTIARLGARFDQDFAAFLESHAPQTHYLKDVTPSFLAFALERWLGDLAVPAYLRDLARHEALQIEVATLLARPKENVPAELALDQGVEFIDAVRLVHYDWAVHRLSEDETRHDEPEASPTSLLVYRSPEHEVRYLELSAFAAALLARLLSERLSLQAALFGATAALGVPLDDARLSATARLLSDLAERGALLGKTSATGPAHDLASTAPRERP